MKLLCSLLLLCTAPVSAFVLPRRPSRSARLFVSAANIGVQTNNGFSIPLPGVIELPAEEAAFEGDEAVNSIQELEAANNLQFAEPVAVNGFVEPQIQVGNDPVTTTLEATHTEPYTTTRTAYERQQVNNVQEEDACFGTVVNLSNGYVTAESTAKAIATTKKAIAAATANIIAKSNGYSGDVANGYDNTVAEPESANGYADAAVIVTEPEMVVVTEPEIEVIIDEEEDQSDWDSGDFAVSAFEQAFQQVQDLAEENKALRRELLIMQESEEELLYEQTRLEGEVELLQDQMIHLQNQYRTVLQEQEKLLGELQLLLLERQATQVDYEEKLSVDTRLQQAELRLRQKGIYEA